jgi:hypothetical protein
MKSVHSMLVVVAVAGVLGGSVGLDAVDTQVDYDKAFDFKTLRTWGWDPAEAVVVKMARTQQDDPATMRRKVEPWIREEMTREMARRGLTEASSSFAPDLIVKSFLLLTLNVETQTLGQFLPAVTMWGLPPFAPATQSDKILNRGSLVLDFSAKGTLVWRGVAQSEIAPDAGDKKREERVREGIRDLVKRYPPKPK